jgi:UDP-2-acetamido-2,6-beta-L-arabino-hexul-4-ose reductase
MEEKSLKILVTGAEGFIGKNIVAELNNRGYSAIYKYDLDSVPELLDKYTGDCDFVFHLAGVCRPKEEAEYMAVNYGFTLKLLTSLKNHNNKAPLLITSSTQAALDNPYGRSKKASEDLLLAYARRNNSKVFIYRLPNVFGKWCRPNYNSVVATFCHNISNNLQISIIDPKAELKLVYIDDLLNELIGQMETVSLVDSIEEYYSVSPVYAIQLGDLAALLRSFSENRPNLGIPDLSDDLTKKLYAVFLSYFPADQLSYPLKNNVDERGSFTEFLKTPDRGQVSVNISKPGITKGNHWHHSKCEKFLVVWGNGVIRLRRVANDEIYEYRVSGERPEVVDIPAGYTHHIENVGTSELVTIMWANEPFNPERPDTYSERV